VALRVGLDDLGADDVEEPAWRDLPEVVGQGDVDDANRELVELPAQRRGLARDPRLEPQLLHRGPPRREAVAQVERVRDVPAAGDRVDPASDRELDQ